ncbi:MAG: ATPase [Anaerolineae bacterium]|nr:ATPase [Anaerolineae bacterium]
MIFLGIDVGASKTHAVLADESGFVLGVGRAGCANWEVVGLDGAGAALKTSIDQALEAANATPARITASGYGLAGLDWPSDETRLGPVVDALALHGPYTMVNDAVLPLRAGTVDGVGLAAIAGSGTTVVGRNRAGQMARSFGAGYPFTDWGGAGDIVMAAVNAVAAEYKGLGPKTSLSARMLAVTGCTELGEFLEKLMRWQVKMDGTFAPQVFAAAHEGDAAALEIVQRVGYAIGANVVAVARRLDMLNTNFDLVTAGGVFSSRSNLLYDSLRDTVRAEAPGITIVHLQAQPVVGALLLAADLVKQPVDKDVLAGQVVKALA